MFTSDLSADDARPTSTLPSGVAEAARLEAAALWLEAELGGATMPSMLVVVGLDDGSLLGVLDACAPEVRVLALEPDRASAERFRASLAWRGWLESGRLVYLTDPEYTGADAAWKLFPASVDAHKLIVHPRVAREGGPAAIRALRMAKQIIFGAKANANARRRFAPAYLAGSLHNLPEILRGQDVRALTDVWRGLPAVVVGAGPSLDANLDDLVRLRDRAVIIAADTALRPLLHRGVMPHLVVAVDPQATNARHFHGLPECPDTWLVSEASIDPSVVTPFGDRTFWFRVSNHQPWAWYQELGIDVGKVDVWGSVLTAAFQVAVQAGCDPIVFAGADMAFTHGRPYGRGTTYEFDWAYSTANGNPITDAWHSFLKPADQLRVPDVHGVETTTSGYLQSFRDWMLTRAKQSGRRIINATGAGILHGEGIEQRTLDEAVSGSRTIPRVDARPRMAPGSLPATAIAIRVREVQQQLRAHVDGAPLDQWREFSGEGFSPVAIDRALDRAAATLEAGTPSVTPDPSPLPWPAIVTSAATRTVLTEVAEAIARLRAALAGEPLPASPAAATRGESHALLGDAFDILCAVSEAAARRDVDLGSTVAADQLTKSPLGALPSWPPQFGWAVRLAEAMLGKTCVATVARHDDVAFFSKPAAPRATAATTASAATPPETHPNFNQACALLALEWVLCTAQIHSGDPSVDRPLAAWWRALAASLVTPFAPNHGEPRATLVLQRGAQSVAEVPLTASSAHLARALTGALTVGRTTDALPNAVTLARLAAPRGHLGVSVRLAPGALLFDDTLTERLVVPRVLTDERVPRATLPYVTPHGAVCTLVGDSRSVLIRADGSVQPMHTWPRSVVGELPFGDNGAVAWGIEHAAYPGGGSGYVLWRSTAEGPVSEASLPFAPQSGTWWRGRLFWACFPFGVGSWAPGEDARFALPDLTLFAIHAHDAGLTLSPRYRTATGAAERRALPQAWSWQVGQRPQLVDVGPLGVVSSQSSAHGWSATAHPEADNVRLVHDDGIVAHLTCYYPFGAAWTGRSLLISTADGELLLFERLADVLDAVLRNASGEERR